MTDPVPSKALTIALERVAEYRKTRHMIGMPYQEFMIALADEITRLRTTLTGISTCSTCEACRGAANLALGDPTARINAAVDERLDRVERELAEARAARCCDINAAHPGKHRGGCPAETTGDGAK